MLSISKMCFVSPVRKFKIQPLQVPAIQDYRCQLIWNNNFKFIVFQKSGLFFVITVFRNESDKVCEAVRHSFSDDLQPDSERHTLSSWYGHYVFFRKVLVVKKENHT